MYSAQLKIRGKSHLVEAKVNPLENSAQIEGNQISPDKTPLENPITGTVYGVLLNYKGVLSKFKTELTEPPYKAEPIAPIMYIKPENTKTGYGAPIPIPEEVATLQVGAALGIVIGKTATRVSEEEAMEYISGYTIVNDVSIPHDSIFRPAVKEKSRDSFCPIGPWVVDAKDVKNPDELGIRVFVNDVLQQENNTSNLVRSIPRLLADVTEFMTLSRGDLLLVGVPENAPLVKEGDEVRIEIEEIGHLTNKIINEKHWLEEASI